MKFLDYLFHGKELRYIDSYFKMLNGYSPTFTSYNGGVYEMDLTRSAHSNRAAGRAAADTASGSRRTSRRAGRERGCK